LAETIEFFYGTSGSAVSSAATKTSLNSLNLLKELRAMQVSRRDDGPKAEDAKNPKSERLQFGSPCAAGDESPVVIIRV